MPHGDWFPEATSRNRTQEIITLKSQAAVLTQQLELLKKERDQLEDSLALTIEQLDTMLVMADSEKDTFFRIRELLFNSDNKELQASTTYNEIMELCVEAGKNIKQRVPVLAQLEQAQIMGKTMQEAYAIAIKERDDAQSRVDRIELEKRPLTEERDRLKKELEEIKAVESESIWNREPSTIWDYEKADTGMRDRDELVNLFRDLFKSFTDQNPDSFDEAKETEIARLKSRIKTLEQHQAICHCGTASIDHNVGDGHTPVDMTEPCYAEYEIDRLYEKLFKKDIVIDDQTNQKHKVTTAQKAFDEMEKEVELLQKTRDSYNRLVDAMIAREMGTDKDKCDCEGCNCAKAR